MIAPEEKDGLSSADNKVKFEITIKKKTSDYKIVIVSFMLEFLKVQSPNQIKHLLKSYDPLKETWIVSDLKSKQEIQNETLQKYSYYTDEAILRVSDFWRLWIRRIEPTLNVVSSDFIKSLVQHFVDNYGATLEVVDSEVSTLNKAVQEFAPILLHPSSDDVLQEWMDLQQPEKKWRRWYQLAKSCLNYIVFDKNVIDSKWCAAYLQTLDLSFLKWDRKIYIDLGSELSSVEMGLFKYLSQSQDVVIISPDPIWKEKFPYLLNTYKENFGFGKTHNSLNPDFDETRDSSWLSQNQFIRVSTQLAEVKYAVSKIRKWAEEGVELDKMAIISSDIETYWPVLQFYLEEEGLSYKKDLVIQLSGLGEVQNLMAAIKNISQDVSWDSLEKNIFSEGSADFENSSNLNFKFEKFKALFYQLYDEDDLNRDQKIKSLFYKKIDFNVAVSRDEFISYLVKTWMGLPHNTNQSNDLFEIIFKDFLSQSLDIKLKFSRWVQFLKNRMGHKEITVKKNSESGVYVLPLMSAQLIEATHKIFIGLNDEYYHKKQNSLMTLNDSIALRTEFDLAVDYSEESYLDFNLRWQSLDFSQNTFFTSAHLSFAADPLNASAFFIENSPQSELVEPENTRVDELQKQLAHSESVSQIYDVNQMTSAERLIQDITKDPPPAKLNLNNIDIFRQLSVSDSESYAQCAFKLLASKGFRLKELPQVALDLDPRQKGSLVHALFEFCIEMMKKGIFTTEKVSEFLDQKRIEFNIFQQYDAHWIIQKNKLILLTQKFYQFEKIRLEIFDIETEKSIEMYFDLNKLGFTIEKPERFILFKMRLDRVDTHKIKKYSVVYDYKSSKYQAENYGKWLNDSQFQMLLYLTALELTFRNERKVKGALYYQYKNFDLSRGLLDTNIALDDFLLSKRNKSLIDEESKSELVTKFVEQISEVLKNLDAHVFTTKPKDIKLCDDCDWRKLCRAAHLMS